MKTSILAILLMIPFMTFAAEKSLNEQQVKTAIAEATTHLKQEFSRELKQSIGLNEFALKVDLAVDEKKLERSLSVKEEDWDKIKGLALPGLFVEGKDSYKPGALRAPKKEDILLSIKTVKIQLVYHEDNYTSEFLVSSLKKIVSFNLPSLGDAQISISPEKAPAPYRVKTESTQEVLTKAFEKPFNVNVNLPQGEFQSFWNLHHKEILIAGAALFLVVGLFLVLALRGSVGSLSEVIKSKTLGQGSSQGASPAAGPISRGETLSAQRADSSVDTFESYIQANEHLAAMALKEPKVFNEVILLKHLAEDFVSLTILLDILPKEKREMFLGNIDQQKKERFKEFIVGHGTSVLKDETYLKLEAIKMIKLVKVASLSPNELYQIVLKDLVTSLKLDEVSLLLKASEETEKAFICEQLEANELAYLVQNSSLTPADLERDVAPITKSEMVELLIKASSIRGFNSLKVKKEKLESVYAQVETDKAEVLADAMGLPASLRFEKLFTRFQDSALKYLEAQDFDNLSLLYPLLTETMRKELVKKLPELLAERLRFSKKKINAESLKLKGDFYFYLRSQAETLDDDVPELKLAS